MLRAALKARMNENIDIATMRARTDASIQSQAPAPADVRIESIHLGGVPTEQLSTQNTLPRTAILYLHGGGWSSGSPRTHRPITWRLAKLTGATVYALDFRLAPEHPYPAALNDCMQAYRALLEQGLPASSLVVAGDSSGGNMALALALRLKAENQPQPAALVCLSPITDVTCSGASYKTNLDTDVLVSPNLVPTMARHSYCPGVDLTNPFISPLYGNVAGLPPTYFQVASDELLLDDSTRMAERMQTAGVTVVLDIWPDLWHEWPIFSDAIPEGEQALAKIATFIASSIK
jgi:acetyl esterase/lipase